MDCVVLSWLYGTLSNDLVDIVLSKRPHGSIARTTWLAIEAQFLGNKEARALHLDARFRTFVQGDLSITDYCKRFKRIADDLADLGETITDRTLVLNLLRGLNEKFAPIGRHLRRGRPFPSFLEVCDDLILEEITLAEQASTPSTTLLAGTSPPLRHPLSASPAVVLDVARGTGGLAGLAAPPSQANAAAASAARRTRAAALLSPPQAVVAQEVPTPLRPPRRLARSGPRSTTPGRVPFRCGPSSVRLLLHRLSLLLPQPNNRRSSRPWSPTSKLRRPSNRRCRHRCSLPSCPTTTSWLHLLSTALFRHLLNRRLLASPTQ